MIKVREKVDEIRSFILDGHIPYVTFVMLNNGRHGTGMDRIILQMHLAGRSRFHLFIIHIMIF